MQKRIILIASAIGILVLFIAGAYYVAIFLPQKQKATIENVKLELEAKIEQEKTEQAKIEQEKQQAEEEKQQKIAEEESNQAELKAQQQKTTDATLKKCLNDAEALFKSKMAIAKDISDPTIFASVASTLQNKRSQDRNECYK